MQIKTTKMSADELYSVYCVHIPSIFASCQFWPILPNFGQFKALAGSLLLNPREFEAYKDTLVSEIESLVSEIDILLSDLKL